MLCFAKVTKCVERSFNSNIWTSFHRLRTKRRGFILWEPWMRALIFIMIHKIFQCVNKLTARLKLCVRRHRAAEGSVTEWCLRGWIMLLCCVCLCAHVCASAVMNGRVLAGRLGAGGRDDGGACCSNENWLRGSSSAAAAAAAETGGHISLQYHAVTFRKTLCGLRMNPPAAALDLAHCFFLLLSAGFPRSVCSASDLRVWTRAQDVSVIFQYVWLIVERQPERDRLRRLWKPGEAKKIQNMFLTGSFFLVFVPVTTWITTSQPLVARMRITKTNKKNDPDKEILFFFLQLQIKKYLKDRPCYKHRTPDNVFVTWTKNNVEEILVISS